jgi:hypothetical protein
LPMSSFSTGAEQLTLKKAGYPNFSAHRHGRQR